MYVPYDSGKRCSYMQIKYKGSTFAHKKLCNVGDVCKYFEAEFFHLYKGYVDYGNTVTSNEAPLVWGAVWLSQPTSYTTAPTYKSITTYDLNKLPQVSSKDQTCPGLGHIIKFEFNDTSHPSPNNYIWIGLYANDSNADQWLAYTRNYSSTEEWVNYGPQGGGLNSGAGFRPILIDYGTGGVGPGISKPTIKITEHTNICRKDGSATVKWDKSDNASSTTWVVVNGNTIMNGTNSGDNAGSFTFKPSNYGVGQGASYTVTVYRKNDYGSGTIVSDSKTFYTYTEPSLTTNSLNKTINPINANYDSEKFTWGTNTPKWKDKGLESHKQTMYINGNKTSELNGNQSDVTSVLINNIGRYVNFNKDASKPDQIAGQTVEVKIIKEHANDSNVPSASITTTVKVLRVPTQQVGSVRYELFDIHGNSIVNSLPEDAIVDRETSSKIRIHFTYPSNLSNYHYGILNGYHIQIETDSNFKWTRNERTSTVSYYVDLPVNEMKYSDTSEITITPYYWHQSASFNTSVDNKEYEGLSFIKRFPSIITRLRPPTIIYPTNNCKWINDQYRILFQLPPDGDYLDYPSTRQTDYRYRDVQVKVTAITGATSSSRTYTWTDTNQNKVYSTDTLNYERRVIVNPSLYNYVSNASQYQFQIRVRKKYGYPESGTYAEASWSEWSAARTINVSPISYNVNKGEYIMASHFNILETMNKNMKDSYPLYETVIPHIVKGDFILADDFDQAKKDIDNCYNVVHTWGVYTSGRNNVDWNNGAGMPSFNGVRGEYVTAAKDDKIVSTSPTFDGRNYIRYIIDLAHLCK